MSEKNPIMMTCQTCNHAWPYKGKKTPSNKHRVYVTCPNCYDKVKMGVKA